MNSRKSGKPARWLAGYIAYENGAELPVGDVVASQGWLVAHADAQARGTAR